jgi:hypothetical protein
LARVHHPSPLYNTKRCEAASTLDHICTLKASTNKPSFI